MHSNYRYLLAALGLGVMLATPRIAEAQTFKHGDVNGDGLVTALDAQAILSSVVGLSLPSGFVVANGDADCNSAAGALDAQIVLSYVIGLPVTQYCVAKNFGPGATVVSISPTDTSVLVNRGLMFRATLNDSAGFQIQRPVAWTSASPELLSIDSTRADTVWITGRTNAGTATLTASADGSAGSTTVKVVTSYAGIVIQPQRGDTLRQLNLTRTFNTKTRDSLGALSGAPAAFWTVLDTNIASVTPVSPASGASGVVTPRTTGATWLKAVSTTSGSVMDSVRVVVTLPALNTCTGLGGTLHATTTYTTPQTWSATTNPHYVTGTQTFNSGARLTLTPGTLVCINSGVSMNFNAGTRLIARGLPDNKIRITSATSSVFWGVIQLGVASSQTGTPPLDTSVVTNAVIERGSNSTSTAALSGREQHAFILDSVSVREMNGSAVRLYGPGSRMSRSVIDTVSVGATGGQPALMVGRGTLEFTAIRNGPNGTGVRLDEVGTVRDVSIVGGAGLSMLCCFDSARVNNVSITGPTRLALDVSNGALHRSSANVTVSGGTAGAFTGRLYNLATLFADSVKQETLKANGRDTLYVSGGGAVRGVAITVRPDLPWRVSATIEIDSASRLNVRPGASLLFASGYLSMQNGGRLNARGTAALPVNFRPAAAGSFSGLLFLDAPLPGGALPPPVDTSYLVNARVSNASGVCAYWTCSAISTYPRHMVVIDSSVIRQSGLGGVGLAAPNSRISRSSVDTTGSPTASYAGIFLGPKTLAETTTVRRSGNIGVYAHGDSSRVRAVRIVGSLGVGLQADNGRILADPGTVRADSANAYGFRGDLENLATLARDSASQVLLVGNADSVITITGGTLTRDTITAIPQLRWRVESSITIDTLGHFRLRPGARLSFQYAGIILTRGGTMDAHGQPGKLIRFEPQGSSYFYGLRFDNPGGGGGPFGTMPVALSTLINVRVDSATGQCATLGCAAIATSDRHAVIMDSALVRMSVSGGVHLAAAGSRISRSTIDTTTTVSYAALALGRNTLAESTTVRRSGGSGVYIGGGLSDTARIRALTILGSVGVGLQAEAAKVLADSASILINGNAYAFRGYVDNFAAVARDSLSQLKLLGNTLDVAVIVGNSGRPFRGRPGRLDTLRVIPQLPWQVTNDVYIDTLARLLPSPGARVGFWSGSMHFAAGGRLISRGTFAAPVFFEKYSATSGQFYGLRFLNAGGSAMDTSVIVNTVVHTIESCQSGSLTCSALAPYDRHVLLIDSTTVRGSTYTAVTLAAPGSRILRSVIDTAGQPSSYAGLWLGRATLAEATTVKNSRGTGVYVDGSITNLADTVRLRSITIMNSGGIGLHAEAGRLVGDSASVTTSGNNTPFRGFVDNFAAIAPDSISQLQLLGNVDNTTVIVGRSDRPFVGRPGRDTIRVIPQLPWLVVNGLYFDSLARLKQGPATRIGFWSGSLHFRDGGRLLVRGSAAQNAVLERHSPSSGQFYGIQFLNPPGSAVDTSYVVNAQVRTIESCQSGALTCSVLATYDRHMLIVDSSTIRGATYTAVSLAAPGSRISRSLVDTAGQVSSYPGVLLGRATLAESTTVRFSRGTGVQIGGSVTAPADTIRLRGVQIQNSGGAGLHAEGGFLLGDSGSVTLSGNAYPFYGYIDNFATLARDSLQQVKFLGNTDDVAFIIGRSDRPLIGKPALHSAVPLTLWAIPQLRLEFRSQTYFDTLTKFQPRKGARLRFENAGLIFQAGATLSAVGTALDSANGITFKPARAGVNFYGLLLANPGAPTGAFPPPFPIATSTMAFVMVDSASGQGSGYFGGSVALTTQDRHRLLISDARLRRSLNAAIYLGAPGSSITRVRIDTTGNPTTSYSAVALNDSIAVDSLTVYRPGNIGVYTEGRGITLKNVLVRKGTSYGLYFDVNSSITGSRGLTLSAQSPGALTFTADSNALGGVLILADSVQVASCVVQDNGTTASHHGIAVNTARVAVQVHNCSLVNNAGNGVHNTTALVANVIDAANNWWGDAGGPSVGTGDGVSANVTATLFCTVVCTTPAFVPMGSGLPPAPALPAPERSTRGVLRSRRRKRLSG